MIWVQFKSQLDFLKSQSEAIIAIKKAFDKEEIMIPFPIRTLDFGIKGGEKLNEIWPQENKRANSKNESDQQVSDNEKS